MKIEDIIDWSKGWYAIEMEIMGTYDEIKGNESRFKTYKNNIITKNFIKKQIKKAEKKHKAKIEEPEIHAESANIREYTIKTNNIKAKSDVYLAVGKYTRNNTHSPIGVNGYISGGTHMHIFLTKKWWEYVKKNFRYIYSRLLKTKLYCKINYIKHQMRMFHRERIDTINTMIRVMEWVVLYGKTRWIGLSREFNSIEFRANNVIHPFQFLYYLLILNIDKKIYKSDTGKDIDLIEGNRKNRGNVLPKEKSIMRYSKIWRNVEILANIKNIIENTPRDMIADEYWVNIIIDYLRTIWMNTKQWNKNKFKEFKKKIIDLHNNAKNDQNQENMNGIGIIEQENQIPSNIRNEWSEDSTAQEITSV